MGKVIQEGMLSKKSHRQADAKGQPEWLSQCFGHKPGVE